MRHLPELELPMHCIPVLDLMNGGVVRAVQGNRADYRPLRSVLTESSAPRAVAAALREAFDSRTFYIADLDAILGRGSNRAAIEALALDLPDCEWWLDAGFNAPDALAIWQDCPGVRCVIGSESLQGLSHYAGLRGPRANILSLDRKGNALMGPAELWSRPDLWPEKVIAMNLAQVGAARGPDFAYLDSLRQLAPHVTLVAAGGTRHLADLLELQARGISAVLLATALHDGSLTRTDLRQLALAN